MALYSAKTWVGILSYNSLFVFLGTENPYGDWDFHREVFITSLQVYFHISGLQK